MIQLNIQDKKNTTARRSRAVSTPASYLGDPGFKSQSVDQLYWMWHFVAFLSTSKQIPRQYLKSVHGRINVLSNTLFTNHLIIQRHMIWATESVVE
jgi:hypothetical protein